MESLYAQYLILKFFKMKRIPITKPSISSLEINYVNDAITNGWGDKCYYYLNKFENEFSNYIGNKYSIATSSCTGAIHLSLLALGLKKGDEVIVPESTWIASVEPILYIGAKPIFVDIEKKSWCIDPDKIKMSLTPKTKGIIAVHLYGNSCNMEEIMKIAKENNLWVVEDTAEAIGSTFKEKKLGSYGNIGVFSFHGTKTMSTGEGGILSTNDINLFKKATILNDHGRDKEDPEHKIFWMRNYGYKYKMSNLQAAMGCAQLKRIDDLVKKKRLIFNWYYNQLIEIGNLSMNHERSDSINSYWMPTLVLDDYFKIDRDELIKRLDDSGINSRPFFYPLSSLPMFESITKNKNSYKIGAKGINLPSYYDMSEKDVIHICDTIKSILSNY